jgi:uncharacterized protein YndB with AHSA1/START domain
MAPDSNVADTIERDVFIAAPVEKVWELVSVPGWWINDGTIDLDSVERLADDRAIFHRSDAGDFLVERLAVEAPRTATFRWLVSGAQEQRLEVSEDQFLHTCVTFTLTSEPGGTRLTVAESGFAAATMDEQARYRAYTDNAEGWGIELGAARAYLEAVPQKARS